MRDCYECHKPLTDDWGPGICPTCLLSCPEASAGVAAESAVWISAHVAETLNFAERYEFLSAEPLSSGGQGQVFHVRDRRLRRPLALKRLRERFSSSVPAQSRFLAEAQIASQLAHPGILPIYDFGLDPQGRLFYTTSLLPGTTFGDVVRAVRDRTGRSDWTLPRALNVLVRVCEIMAYAHKRGVFHRDLKPANLMIGEFGEVIVIDLGSASVRPVGAQRSVGDVDASESVGSIEHSRVETDRLDQLSEDPGSPLATHHAGQPGTMVFLPPEIIQNPSAPVGPQVDIYSVGVMLYELFSGRLPYSASDGSLPAVPDLRNSILHGPPAPLRSLNHSISPDLVAICAKAMQREPALRYTSMTDLAEDIRAFLEIRPVRARGAGLAMKIQKWTQRNSLHVISACLMLTAITAGGSVALRLKSQHDHARQVTALREAELARRSGRWREVLDHLRAAEKAGYKDAIQLGLARLEVHTVLSDYALAKAELDKLTNRTDLGRYRGSVLLRQGEYELFDPSTFASGAAHVREALKVGLDRAEVALAQGLLSDSTTNALDKFRQALQFDPYQHSAHRHSLGLEFLLGRFTELESHRQLFAVIFPEDPSPGIVTAIRLALDGQIGAAEQVLAPYHDAFNPRLWGILHSSLKIFSNAASFFDVDVYLGAKPFDEPGFDQILTNAFSLFLAGTPTGNSTNQFEIRLPQLPSLRNGVHEGIAALRDLSAAALRASILPFLGTTDRGVERIKLAWQRHPEALLPLGAAMFLEMSQPTKSPRLRELLAQRAALYQMAADSQSVLPKACAWARFHAAEIQFDLSTRHQPPDPQAREACVNNLWRVADSSQSTAAECQAYFNFALVLNELDVARQLLVKWERLVPKSKAAPKSRIELELAAGAYGTAFGLITQFLQANPDDQWALQKREAALAGIAKLKHAPDNPDR